MFSADRTETATTGMKGEAANDQSALGVAPKGLKVNVYHGKTKLEQHLECTCPKFWSR